MSGASARRPSAQSPSAHRDAPARAPRIVHWFAAAIAIMYGLAKLNGAQFTVLDSELDRPMGEVSGFWLTWYYFGYSKVYGNLIALVQVVGGVLLTFPRLALGGALLLLPVAVNIVLVDVFYRVDIGGLVAALVLLGLLLWIVAPHAHRLWHAIVLPPAAPADVAPRWHRWLGWLAWAGRVLLVAWLFVFTWRTARYNNRAPTPIDGVWQPVGGVTPGGIDRVFFEYQRAHMVVLRDTTGEYTQRHFEVGPADSVRIWAEWLDRGELLYQGRWVRDSALVRLRPTDAAPAGEIVLRRLPER